MGRAPARTQQRLAARATVTTRTFTRLAPWWLVDTLREPPCKRPLRKPSRLPRGGFLLPSAIIAELIEPLQEYDAWHRWIENVDSDTIEIQEVDAFDI